ERLSPCAAAAGYVRYIANGKNVFRRSARQHRPVDGRRRFLTYTVIIDIRDYSDDFRPRPSRFLPYALSQSSVRIFPELACGILGNEYDESCLVHIVPLKVASCDELVPHGMNKSRRDRLHSVNGWNFSFTVCPVFGIQDITADVAVHRQRP